MRIVILGYIIRAPYGGLCWDPLQFTLGLKRLGHDVLFLEDSDDYPGCHNYKSTETADYKGFAFIKDLFSRYGLSDQWAYFDSLQNNWYGLAENKVKDFCSSAEIVLNISGVNPLREWLSKIPCRIFLDTDPLYTQVKILQDPLMLAYAKEHTCHFSIGENIGQTDCTIPVDEFNWKATRQPVVLDIWKPAPPINKGKWTTILAWKSYKTVEYKGVIYGMKDKSFADYINLPAHLPNEAFELGISCDEETKNYLVEHRWGVVNSIIPTEDPWIYKDYVIASKGEWSIAKHGFVISNCGFLSERSMNYMASGKPVVIQDTAFSKYYPTGEGLVSFTTLEEAIEGINRINADYLFHCKRAREVVEECCDHTKVLSNLLAQVS
jgi:hypothetical protein